MKSQVLHTVWCNISGEVTGEIRNWSLLGVEGIKEYCSCMWEVENALLLNIWCQAYNFRRATSNPTTLLFGLYFSSRSTKNTHPEHPQQQWCPPAVESPNQSQRISDRIQSFCSGHFVRRSRSDSGDCRRNSPVDWGLAAEQGLQVLCEGCE